MRGVCLGRDRDGRGSLSGTLEREGEDSSAHDVRMGAAGGVELGMGGDGRSRDRVAAAVSKEGEGPRGRHGKEGVRGDGGVREMNG